MRTTRRYRRIGSGFLAVLMAALGIACNNPIDPLRIGDIEGYAISGQADGTDPATGEALSCVFIVERLRTGGPLVGSWTDTATVRVIRLRKAETQSVTYDTTMVAQQATISIPDSTHIVFSIGGPLTDTLSATMVAAYPGYAQGDWSCGPEHPLARVHPT